MARAGRYGAAPSVVTALGLFSGVTTSVVTSGLSALGPLFTSQPRQGCLQRCRSSDGTASFADRAIHYNKIGHIERQHSRARAHNRYRKLRASQRARIVYAGPRGDAVGEYAPAPGVTSPPPALQRSARPMGCRGETGCTLSKTGA